MIGELIGGILAGIIGVALVVYIASLARKAIQHQHELHRKRGEISSQDTLEEFIRRVNRVTTGEELDHLDNERKDD